jgi:hypothetical protein
MTTIRATDTAVLVVDLHSLLAPGTLVSHLLRLQGLPERPKDRAADGSVGYVTASGKCVAALCAVPDGRVCSPNLVPSTLGTVVQRSGLLFHIRY